MFGGIPFEHFGGGMPGGMPGGGRPGRSSGPVDTNKLYETLEVEKSADDKEIRKAYRRLSRIHHPDKGGDEQKFKEISAAYEILSDEDKRKAYDQYGLEGVSEDGGGPGGASGEDLFSMFFGGGGGGGRGARSRGPRKGPSVNHPLKVSLADVYNGKTVKLAITRKVIDGPSRKCATCDGSGVQVTVRQMGMMIQQMQTTCDDCNGEGFMATRKNQREVLEVHIEKGAKDGQKITFRNKGDESANTDEAGDVNFIVKVKEHDTFQRKGADLLMKKEISLNQALTGLKFQVEHLDGRKIMIQSKPGEIIQPDSGTTEMLPSVKIIPGEGMPSLGNPFVKGNLYVLFRIKFPKAGELSTEQMDALRSILPDPQPEIAISGSMNTDDEENIVEEADLVMGDLRQFGKGGANSGAENAYESDEEGGPRQVECQQS